ncbi:hypothetical protein GGI07_001760 [Coemansia sp. Benny D115]|nr:hypothetical protein GGI07_001760 [Coemansia sp. Benny D115]
MYSVTVAILAIASLAAAQEIGFTQGTNVANGPNAISNPNVNNGWQADSSLFSGDFGGSPNGASGHQENVFNDIIGSSFTRINSNTAFKDNIVNNPSAISVSGNDGWSANGDGNKLGPVENVFGTGQLARRSGDVTFVDNHHSAAPHHTQQVATFPMTHVIRPVVSAAGLAPVGALAKRSGDILFADNHHQVEQFIGAVPQIAPVALAWVSSPVQPIFGAVEAVAPPPAHIIHPIVAHEVPVSADAQKSSTTVIQNQA